MATERGPLRRAFRRTLAWERLKVPPGPRLVLGILPILGFWMAPLGIAIAALDVKPLWHRLRGW